MAFCCCMLWFWNCCHSDIQSCRNSTNHSNWFSWCNMIQLSTQRRLLGVLVEHAHVLRIVLPSTRKTSGRLTLFLGPPCNVGSRWWLPTDHPWGRPRWYRQGPGPWFVANCSAPFAAKNTRAPDVLPGVATEARAAWVTWALSFPICCHHCWLTCHTTTYFILFPENWSQHLFFQHTSTAEYTKNIKEFVPPWICFKIHARICFKIHAKKNKSQTAFRRPTSSVSCVVVWLKSFYGKCWLYVGIKTPHVSSKKQNGSSQSAATRNPIFSRVTVEFNLKASQELDWSWVQWLKLPEKKRKKKSVSIHLALALAIGQELLEIHEVLEESEDFGIRCSTVGYWFIWKNWLAKMCFFYYENKMLYTVYIYISSKYIKIAKSCSGFVFWTKVTEDANPNDSFCGGVPIPSRKPYATGPWSGSSHRPVDERPCPYSGWSPCTVGSQSRTSMFSSGPKKRISSP